MPLYDQDDQPDDDNLEDRRPELVFLLILFVFAALAAGIALAFLFAWLQTRHP